MYHRIIPIDQQDQEMFSRQTSTSPLDSENGDSLPSPKRSKICRAVEEHASIAGRTATVELPAGFRECLGFVDTSPAHPLPIIPGTLTTLKTGNDLHKLRQIFDIHGFRTSVIMSPRPALSIYTHSCRLDSPDGSILGDKSDGKAFLLAAIGLHPRQDEMERCYATAIKKLYCLLLFCKLVRKLCPQASESSQNALLRDSEDSCRSIITFKGNPAQEAHRIEGLVSDRISQLTQAAVKADPSLRAEQFEHEFQRITYRNSSISNAAMQLFLGAHQCHIEEIYLKRSTFRENERITVFLYDQHIDELRPPPFIFLPSIRLILAQGPEAVAELMLQSLWRSMLRLGYYASSDIKAELTPELEKYLLSGIVANDCSIPLLLNAHFTPTYPLSFYLLGKAGSGKSSLVRFFAPSLNDAIEEHADPEILVRFVKQNLNKPSEQLQLELELRPNNNDLSVMSIIQGRRMTRGQSKPGLVVVDLEEMASNEPDANPNQLATAKLISQRFSGRSGEFREGIVAPRNSSKRGISGDARLIPLLTSNYKLEGESEAALKRLDLFTNLRSIEMKAIAGIDRRDFAEAYLKQRILDQLKDRMLDVDMALKLELGEGDTRSLVRKLRVLAFYVSTSLKDSVAPQWRIRGSVYQNNDASVTLSICDQTIALRLSSPLQNLFPVVPKVIDHRAQKAMTKILTVSEGKIPQSVVAHELAHVLDFYFAKTLAPTVILSKDAAFLHRIVQSVGAQQDVHIITAIDVKSYKMMRSLYDPSSTPNLREDILQHGRGVFVVVELHCSDRDSQLMIRDLIEDSPSMTAYSTNKSALYKDGLLFCVHIVGEITPQVLSRGSIIV